MIRIQITKTVTKPVTYIENFVVKETPTAQRKQVQYSGEEVVYEKEFATRECVKQEVRNVELLDQMIEDDEKFNLNAVIKAINNLE